MQNKLKCLLISTRAIDGIWNKNTLKNHSSLRHCNQTWEKGRHLYVVLRQGGIGIGDLIIGYIVYADNVLSESVEHVHVIQNG